MLTADFYFEGLILENIFKFLLFYHAPTRCCMLDFAIVFSQDLKCLYSPFRLMCTHTL
jgi:hypothetical protein